MKILNTKNIKAEIQPLLETKKDGAVSIYLNTSRVWQQNDEAKIKLKNMLSELQGTSVSRLVTNIQKITAEETFWQQLSEGLAMFVSDDYETYFKLPSYVPESLSIEENFNIVPLVDYIQLSSHYFILIFNKSYIQLFECVNKEYEEIEISDSISGLENALWVDDPEKQLRFRNITRKGGRDTDALSFHGHGAHKDAKHKDLLRYISRVDNEITSKIQITNVPVIFVGVREQYNEYRKVTSLNLTEEPLEINAVNTVIQDIVSLAWEQMLEVFSQEKRIAYKNTMDSIDTELTVTQLKQITKLAYEGRIDTLFVREPRELDNTPEEHKLVNYAMIYTLKNGGKVYCLAPIDNNSNSPVVAHLRY